MSAWSAAVAARKPSPSGASHACTPSAPLAGRAPSCLRHTRSCARPSCCEVACPLRKVLRTSRGRSSERVGPTSHGAGWGAARAGGSAHPEAGDDTKACVPDTLISTDSASTTTRAPDPCTMAARLQFGSRRPARGAADAADSAGLSPALLLLSALFQSLAFGSRKFLQARGAAGGRRWRGCGGRV